MTRLVVALMVLTVSAFWSTRGINRSLSARYAAELAESRGPLTINGLSFTFDGLEAVDAPPASPQAEHRLLFVVADSCGLCGTVVPVWTAWLSDLPAPDRVAATIVTFEGSTYAEVVASALSVKGVAHQVHVVKRRDAFRLATGIQSTPQLLILDAEQRIRFVAVRFGEGERRVAAQVLAVHATSGNTD